MAPGLGDLLVMACIVVLALLVRVAILPTADADSGAPTRTTPLLVPAFPASFDEVWHLTLSTGRGSPFKNVPTGQLVPDFPACTALRDAPPWYAVWTSLDSVAHPPLYLQTLRIWRSIFGEGDSAARAYSIAWSCVAVAGVYLLAWRLMGRTAAAYAAAILALSSTQFYYALEIRAYAMMVAWHVMLLYVVVRMQQGGVTPARAIAFGLLLLVMMLTHYFSLPACTAASVYALMLVRRNPAQLRRVALAGIAAAGVYAVIWMPFALRQFSGVPAADIEFLREVGWTWTQELQRLARLPVRLVVEGTSFPGDLLVGAVLLLAMVAIGWWRRELRVLMISLVSILMFLLLLDVSRGSRQIGFLRYSAGASPAVVLLLLAAGPALMPRRIGIHVAGLLLLAAALWGRNGRVYLDSPEPWTLVRAVAPHVMPDETLVLIHRPAGMAEYARYTLQEFAHVPGLFPRDVIVTGRPLPAWVVREFRTSHARCVFVEPPDALTATPIPGGSIESTIAFHPDHPPAGRQLHSHRVALPQPP